EGRLTIGESDHIIPELSVLVEAYERLAAFIRPAKVLGLAVDSRSIEDDAQARERLAEYKRQTGLPATDPVRFGADVLFDAIQTHCSGSTGKLESQAHV
ncbi:MAG: NAD-dependent epimerase/dehydratase family protein, partial [Candidatus Obscuribacterales bacterium]|nr:NAD-dependent epimerase/dehydratase family protein [Candidatus Obscuribacterales bacterium]